MAPEDLADETRLDALGVTTQEALATLAQEIEATQQELAATYAAMIGRNGAAAASNGRSALGMSQQKYEKLRGKLQALGVHLEGLQAQQHTALELLQAEGTVSGNKYARDREIAALVQEANHKENVSALSVLQVDALPWR